MFLLSLCCRRAKGWAGARVFESHGKCHRRFGAGSDIGVFGEKHRRTQSKFEKKTILLLTSSYSYRYYPNKIDK